MGVALSLPCLVAGQCCSDDDARSRAWTSGHCVSEVEQQYDDSKSLDTQLVSRMSSVLQRGVCTLRVYWSFGRLLRWRPGAACVMGWAVFWLERGRLVLITVGLIPGNACHSLLATP